MHTLEVLSDFLVTPQVVLPILEVLYLAHLVAHQVVEVDALHHLRANNKTNKSACASHRRFCYYSIIYAQHQNTLYIKFLYQVLV